MDSHTDEQDMLGLAAKLGVSVSAQADGFALLQWHTIRIVDFLPEMVVMIRSLVAKEAFAYQRSPITVMENGLLVSFQNVFNDGHEEVDRSNQERPHVRVIPSQVASEVRFPKQAHIKQITILIETSYLKRLLGKEHDRFDYLFNVDSTFWIEDFMSPEIAALVDELVNTTHTLTLMDFYYRLKSAELLYCLFKNLLQRESVFHQPMSTGEINAVYKVRNALAASLEKALPVGELVKLSGMNEFKLRRLFTQVFGKGLYAYFQYLRMQEAARLLKEDRLSVSETGYRLGFTNLSHFGRLFEEQMGVKPKKWTKKS